MVDRKKYPNLVPVEETNARKTQEERVECAKNAGLASGRARRLRRTQADILRQILALPAQDPARRELLIKMGLEGNIADSINISVAEKAERGDVEAARYVRDTIGEKPREGLELGNLDDKPLKSIDLSKLSDEQLAAMAAARKENVE